MLEILEFEDEILNENNKKFAEIIMKLKEDLKGIQLSDNTLDAMQKSDLIEQFLNDYLTQETSLALVYMLFKTELFAKQ